MPREVVLSVLQVYPRPAKNETIEAVRRLASKLHSPDIILLPEYLMLDPTGLSREDVARAAEPLDGPWIAGFRRIAEETGSCVATHMFESAPGGRVYNSLVLIGRDGGVIGVYRKTHLFDAYTYRESSVTDPGDVLFEPVDACGARVGAAICYELRFPEVFRTQALRGAEVMLVPAAWYKGPGKEEALRVLAQARSHENGFYTLLASNPGERFVGRSMIVNPWGVVVAEAGWGERVLEFTADLGEVERARSTIPVLKHLRRDLYPVP